MAQYNRTTLAYANRCGKYIQTNIQGNEIGKHKCTMKRTSKSKVFPKGTNIHDLYTFIQSEVAFNTVTEAEFCSYFDTTTEKVLITIVKFTPEKDENKQ